MTGGRVVMVVSPSERRPMPWRNGGGVTHELWTEGDGPCGFAARVSIAEVNMDGPFSNFPGVDRTILLLDGAGFTLTRDDGKVVTFARPHVRFAFAGEENWRCTLHAGPVRDFNVMVDRARWRSVTEIRAPGLIRANFLFTLGEGDVAGNTVAAGTLLGIEGVVRSDVATLAIRSTPTGALTQGSWPDP